MNEERLTSDGVTLCVRVMDGVYGRPAVGVSASLVTEAEGIPKEWPRQRTDETGRVIAILDAAPSARQCRVEFDINGYFATLGTTPFYPRITISLRLPHSVSSHEIAVLITPASYFVFKEG
jgi:5-hydroxyisourate hydrolase-like protein (transthyretin family)